MPPAAVPLRVLVLGTTFPVVAGDGTPEFVLTLSAELAALGHDVTAIVPRVPGAATMELVDGVRVCRFAYLPQRWETLAAGGIAANLRARPSRWLQVPPLVVAFLVVARREARRRRADVVHAHWVVPAGTVARLLRRPYLITVHGADAYTLRTAPLGWIKRWTVRGAAATVPVSRAIGDELRQLGAKVTTPIPMGVDFDGIAAAVGDRRPVAGRVLVIGRLVEKKGIDVLLRAVVDVPTATIRVIGDGPCRTDLTALAVELGVADRVEFVGRRCRSDVLAELAEAAVVALPSRVARDGDTDGVPVVLGEAVAAGVPVVASNAGGLGEHVQDGVNGRLVPAGSVDRLAAALRDLIADPGHGAALATVARDQLVAELGLDAVGARYAALLARGGRPVIAVLHAYSRHNAGDGLLVDLTLDRLRAAGVPTQDCVVLALDPPSFDDLPGVLGIGTPGRSAGLRTAKAAAASAATMLGVRLPSLAAGGTARTLRDAAGYVAVGGGYLRAGSRTNQTGVAINHLPQLEAAAVSRRPSIYLPQSVGPLAGPIGDRVRTLLHRMSSVHLRDERSMVEVGPSPTVHRTPDLAVLRLADRLEDTEPRGLSGSPILVARELGEAAGYRPGLTRLASVLGGVRWAVQADGDATKSDRVFYRDTLRVEPAGRLADLLAGPDPGPVVSVRLHGALQALLAGIPAIHLGYERKSWGTYADLGLSRWVHSARHFDAAAVAAQLRELAADPEPFWSAVRSRAGALRAASAALTDELAVLLGPVG